jgi:AcrR family transcriptional regulator
LSSTAVNAKRRAGKWGDREESILNAAWSLIAERGFDKMTMADVADAVGLSEGSLYNYVPSKRDLAIRVAERWFSQQSANLADTIAALTSTREKIGLLVHRHIAMILEQPELFLMWIREVRATDDYLTSSSREIFRTYTGLLRKAIRNGKAAGELRDEMSDDMIRDMIYGGAEHIAWTAIVQKRTTDLKNGKAAKKLSDTYWRALSVTLVGSDADTLARIEKKIDRLT